MRNAMKLSGMIASAAMVVLALGCQVHATGEKPGRYSMSPVEGGGFVRLDTETGQMSLCQRRDGDWSCREMAEPERGLGSEIDRLAAENKRLKGEIRQMEDIMLGDKGEQGRAEDGTRSGRAGPGFKLPSEQDVDEAMDYAQRMLRRFRERMKEFEGDKRGLPL